MKFGLTGWFSVLLLAGCGSTDPAPTYEEQLAADIEAIDAYLETNGIAAQPHASGIRYVITVPGEGPNPTKDNCVTVNYVGNFLEPGEEPFDSGSIKKWIRTNELILGWQIGLKFFPAGAKGTLYIPSGLGYGPNAYLDIPANSILKFDIEMVAIHEYNSAGGYCNQ
jgi:FKBP-type peptidyl-prolyl cis-trans isomerase